MNYGYFFVYLPFFSAASPGPSVVHAMTLAGNQGFRLASSSILGNTLAILMICTISSMGLSFLHNPYLFYGLKVFGAFYLIYIGAKSLINVEKDNVGKMDIGKHYWAIVRQAILISLTNPKIFIFIAAFFPQFLQEDANRVLSCLIMTITFAFFTFTTLVGYALLSKLLYRNKATRNLIQKGSGVALIVFGCYTFFM